MRLTPTPVLLLACLALSLPAAAHAQTVQRCIGADGRAVYTDQSCQAIGATARLPSAAAGSHGRRLFNGGCPRVLSQLVGEIGAAIEGGDVNRLAGVYDWSGVSQASASRLLDRLEAIVARPLVDIAPVYPDRGPAYTPEAPLILPEAPPAADATAAPARAGGPAAWMPSWSARAPDDPGETGNATQPPPDDAAAEAMPRAAPSPSPPRPVALRIEQTLAGGATPVRTVFGLRRHYGCFWITL